MSTTYTDSQFACLRDEDGDLPPFVRVQLTSEFGKTNFMNISAAQVEQIQRILNQPESVTIPLHLAEFSGNNAAPIEGAVEINRQGVFFSLKGYSDASSVDDMGFVLGLQNVNGIAKVFAFADINREEPTHEVSLAGALNTARRD